MRIVSAVFAIFALLACATESAPPSELTSEDRGSIQAEVLDWSDGWLSAVNEGDAQGAAVLFDQAAAHFMDHTSYQANWQELQTRFQELFGGQDAPVGAWDTRRVDVLAPDLALVTGQVARTGAEAEGQGEEASRSYVSIVVRKEAGVWLGLFGHVSGPAG